MKPNCLLINHAQGKLNTISLLEWFSIEFPKTKTKVPYFLDLMPGPK